MKPGIDVSVREVGLRDGIQNISAFMPTAAKLEWLAADLKACQKAFAGDRGLLVRAAEGDTAVR